MRLESQKYSKDALTGTALKRLQWVDPMCLKMWRQRWCCGCCCSSRRRHKRPKLSNDLQAMGLLAATQPAARDDGTKICHEKWPYGSHCSFVSKLQIDLKMTIFWHVSEGSAEWRFFWIETGMVLTFVGYGILGHIHVL